jgi:hypothetical protein
MKRLQATSQEPHSLRFGPVHPHAHPHRMWYTVA